MNVAVASAHRAEPGSEVGSDCVENRLAESQSSRHVPDERGINIPFAQIQAASGAESLLPSPQINAADDPTGPVEAGKLILHQPSPEHAPSQLFGGILLLGGARTLQRPSRFSGHWRILTASLPPPSLP